MAFTKADIMRFIHQLTLRCDEETLPYTLSELADLIEADGAPKGYVMLIRDLAKVNKEAAELKKYEELTPEQISIAIRRGEARLKREEEERNRSHC